MSQIIRVCSHKRNIHISNYILIDQRLLFTTDDCSHKLSCELCEVYVYSISTPFYRLMPTKQVLYAMNGTLLLLCYVSRFEVLTGTFCYPIHY